MSINLLAGSAIGLFIGMLIIMITVTLLFGFILYMVFKQTKISPESTNVFNVKKMLARRVTQLTIEIMNNKEDEAKKTELLNKLRRVKSAEALVDELIEEEKEISGLADPDGKTQGKKPVSQRNGGQQRPVRRPPAAQPPRNAAGKPAENGQPKSNGQPVAKAAVNPANPDKNKKDDTKLQSSED